LFGPFQERRKYQPKNTINHYPHAHTLQGIPGTQQGEDILEVIHL
jgi:hypothetical protein